MVVCTLIRRFDLSIIINIKSTREDGHIPAGGRFLAFDRSPYVALKNSSQQKCHRYLII